MPKVSEEYREARRDEIARAAVRVLERKGVRETSIADIVEESGLSTGAIYSHFSNKAELARYIVASFLLPRADALEAGGVHGEVLNPREVLLGILTAITGTGMSPSLIVQFWGESMVDTDLHAEMLRTAGRVRGAVQSSLTPWARTRTQSEEEALGLATECARTVIALAQGYISNAAVFGPREVSEYVASAREILIA